MKLKTIGRSRNISGKYFVTLILELLVILVVTVFQVLTTRTEGRFWCAAIIILLVNFWRYLVDIIFHLYCNKKQRFPLNIVFIMRPAYTAYICLIDMTKAIEPESRIRLLYHFYYTRYSWEYTGWQFSNETCQLKY